MFHPQLGKDVLSIKGMMLALWPATRPNQCCSRVEAYALRMTNPRVGRHVVIRSVKQLEFNPAAVTTDGC